jgi:hypothetical protein
LRLFSNIREDEINDQNNNYFCRHDYFTMRGKISDVWWICGDKYFKILEEYREKGIMKILNSKTPIPHQEDVLSEFLAERKVPVKLSKTRWGLQRDQNVTTIWPQKLKKVLAIPCFIKILKKLALQIEEANDKFVIKLGREELLQGRRCKKYARHNRAHVKKNALTRLRWILPRFSAGKFYFKISFLRP